MNAWRHWKWCLLLRGGVYKIVRHTDEHRSRRSEQHGMQVDALKQKIKPTPVVVTPVQTPPAPVQVSGLAVSTPPPVRPPLRFLSRCMKSCAREDNPDSCPYLHAQD